MEPVGLSIAVVTAFKDAYLTAKFIRNTLHSIKTYRSEQSSLVTHLNVEILRLKNFSRIFSSADGNEVDMSLLETVPDQFLQTVCDVFQQLQEVLGQYTSLAASLDADYQKYSPVSPHFKLDLSKVAAKIDDVPSSEETIADEKTDVAVSEGKPRGFFSRLGFGSTKPRKASPTQLTSFITLTPGVQWLFTKGKLQDMLRKFKEWNDALQDLIPSLLVGFGFYENKTLQDRLQSDGEENMFKGHLELNKLSAEGDNSTDEAEDIEKLDVTLLISLEDAKPKENDPRILVEYKKVDDSHTSADHNTKVAKRRVYAPQLAQLLKTAGEHNFGTLPLNSYAWDPENFQYAFFFDYPSIASPQEPKSLHDFILYGESQFKLELKQRFHVGHALAQSISAFHSDGWVHKKIRSHAVKFFFDDKSNKCDFSRPYLTDFEFSRPQGGATRLAARAVVDVEQDVYLHPERYGLKPSVNFRPEHDIYSLGVVLLEIGIWQTAKQIHDTIVKYNYGGIPPPGGVTAQEIKETFILEATERLAHRMGSSYQQAVVACLDGDWDQYTSPREFTSEFQRRVIQKVDMKAFLS